MRAIFFVVLLLITNLLTFGYSYNRCKQEKIQLQTQLQSTIREGDQLYVRYKSAESELQQLQVWKSFVQLQRDLNQLVQEIEKLNFGVAIQQLDTITGNVRSGKYGSQLQSNQNEFLPVLQQARVSLEQKDEQGARASLAEFNRRVLQLFSGVSPAIFESANTQTSRSQQTQTKPIPAPEPEKQQ
jgi:hypothetical protein